MPTIFNPVIIPGTIALWHSSIATIPDGWVLCDGNNGTPDLRDVFIQGAGGARNPGDTGGAAAHTHTGTTGAPSATVGVNSGLGFASSATHTHEFTTGSTAHTPPFHALAFIMRV